MRWGRSLGIRARVTLATVLTSAIAMVLVVALAAYAASEGMRKIIETSLSERLDAAQALVAKGDLQGAVDQAGVDLLQVVGTDGQVLASTANAQGLAAMLGDELRDVLDDVEFERDDDDDEDDEDDDRDDDDASAVSSQVPYSSAQTGVADADHDSGDDQEELAEEQSGADEWDDVDDAVDESAAQGAAWDDDDSDDTLSASATDDYDEPDYASDTDADTDSDDDSYDDSGDDDTDVSDAADRTPLPHWLHTLTTLVRGMVRPAIAYAQEAEFVQASDLLDTSGPFLIMRRQVSSPVGLVTLVAVTTLAPALEVAYSTARLLALGLATLLVGVGLFAWHMTGRTLQPVDQLRTEVDAITAKELSRRVTAPDDPDLARLATTFNRMLERVETAVTAQKRFVSDASHELKSPVAATGLILDALRACPDDLQSQQVLDDLAFENDRLAHIVGDLLTLARSDEGRLVVNKTPSDLLDVLLEEAAALQRRSSVQVDTSGVQPAIGLTDATLLSHTLRNLLDNAARYARQSVWLSCEERDGSAVICVSDDGPGIAPQDRERVFERFVRLEERRPSSTKGTGLGLPVTREIVESLGGTVAFVEPEHGGATARITVPLT